MFVFLALQSWMLYPYRMGIQLLQEVNMILQPTTSQQMMIMQNFPT
ncbi:hypothetical protein E2C01_073077 [Portunus trituberculatus]|uniref:Uncharacterized protein n=1 Tax=Portunus trituberculatus TaxID=210409 RepID=A0A5B7I9L1_PORTR|nr:hypothetical protein [Portunus trituberculatus]